MHLMNCIVLNVAKRSRNVMLIMEIWTASAIDSYYRDPAVEFLKSGHGGIRKPHAAGYYIVPHCSPNCSHGFGSHSAIDLGPFSTPIKARNWSRKHLVVPAMNVD